MTDAGELNLTEQSYYEEAIGETAYNSYTNVLYVFPDHVCEQLLPVLPIIVAVIVSTVVIVYFVQTISAEISAYIGFGTLMLQSGITVGILALLLICYFLCTWILFRRSVAP